MKNLMTIEQDRISLRTAYERGLRYRELLLATGRSLRCDQCRTCLKDAVRLLALSKIDRSSRIADALAEEYGVTREQVREDCYFSAAVDTVGVYCGDDAKSVILRGQKYLDVKTVLSISRTAPERQRYEMARVRQGRRPLDTEGKGCPVYDTVDFKEILSRLRRAQGKLYAGSLGLMQGAVGRSGREEARAVRGRLKEIKADVRELIRGVRRAPDGVPCPCDRAKKPAAPRKAGKGPVIPRDLKAILGLLNQSRSWTGKSARDLPQLLRAVSPIPQEKEEVSRRGRAVLQAAASILQALA